MSDTQESNNKQVESHVRVVDTLLGSHEKKVLLWLAARMPAWVVPDTLTLIGLLASFLIFFGYALTIIDKHFLWLASFGFILQWFGDSLDGTLARYRKIERPRYGFFVDHIIDTISEALIFLGLGISPYLHFDLALLALVGYLLLGTYVYLATYVNGVFRISYARLGPTEARVLALIANVVVFYIGTQDLYFTLPLLGRISASFYDIVALIFSALVLAMFIFTSISTAMMLSREDRVAASQRRRAQKAARRQALSEQRLARKTAAQSLRGNHPADSHLTSNSTPASNEQMLAVSAEANRQPGGTKEQAPVKTRLVIDE